jgi:hypothetical protein
MITLKETKEKIENDGTYCQIHLMDFVDDFRYYKNKEAIRESFNYTDERFDALLASTADQLCAELKMEPPQWIEKIPAVKNPWFVSGLDNLKAITLVESPLHFRKRKIFVLENFLQRV